MSTPDKVAAVIPAYNESRYIGAVLAALREVDIIAEIIIVDDGSRDATAEKVRQAAISDARIQLIQHPKNLGKGQAVLTGRKATKAPVILMLDADLMGLKPAHVSALIQPVLGQIQDMTLGLFKAGRFLTDLAHWATPWLTGQRCLRAQILDALDVSAARGYGLETTLSMMVARDHWRTGVVWLDGVWHPQSELHRGLLLGLPRRVSMYLQIIRAWWLGGGLSVLWAMFRKWIPILLALMLVFVIFRTVFSYFAAGRTGDY